jgi:hypothetical protein
MAGARVRRYKTVRIFEILFRAQHQLSAVFNKYLCRHPREIKTIFSTQTFPHRPFPFRRFTPKIFAASFSLFGRKSNKELNKHES